MIRILRRGRDDARDLQERINRVLASAVTVDELLNKTTELIASALQAKYCFIFLNAPDWQRPKIIGRPAELTPTDISEALASKQLHLRTAPTVMTLARATDKSLLQAMRKTDMALIVRLERTNNGLGGFLVASRPLQGTYDRRHEHMAAAVAQDMSFAAEKTMRLEIAEKAAAALEQKVESATTRLRQTTAKLKALDQTKDDFISMASHQLRTPLTSVKGYVSMVLDGDAGDLNGTQRKLLNQAFISSQRMVYLISDLLNVSRMRTGKFVLESVACNLADVVEGEVAQLVETAKSRNLSLMYDKPDHFPTYLLDETKLRQVIMNFIDNAIYYTPDGGHITVGLVEKSLSIELTVTDDGMGVPKSEQHRLFSKFFRAHNAKRARPDGTGLGLYMAKKVVVAQGGAIIFRSQEGKGSTFGFSFARSKLVQAPKSDAAK